MDCREAHAEHDFCERLLLLLIAQPREGWEAEFEELIRREMDRLAIPAGESGRHE